MTLSLHDRIAALTKDGVELRMFRDFNGDFVVEGSKRAKVVSRTIDRCDMEEHQAGAVFVTLRALSFIEKAMEHA